MPEPVVAASSVRYYPRMPRFTLKTLFLSTTLIAGGLGMWIFSFGLITDGQHYGIAPLILLLVSVTAFVAGCLLPFIRGAKKRWKIGIMCAVLLLVYLASYFYLSRRGYAEADHYGMDGFYYLPPENSDTWRGTNWACVSLFWPVNAIDRHLGFGRDPAYEPLWGLSE